MSKIMQGKGYRKFGGDVRHTDCRIPCELALNKLEKLLNFSTKMDTKSH